MRDKENGKERKEENHSQYEDTLIGTAFLVIVSLMFDI